MKTKKKKWLTSWWDYPALMLPCFAFLGLTYYLVWQCWLYWMI